MNGALQQRITAHLENSTGSKLTDPSDVWLHAGLSGDDWHEFVDGYAREFNVDMTDYRWYYHGDEEGLLSFGGLVYPPPQRQVTRIPVSVDQLAEFAVAGTWRVTYPVEEVDLRRRDMVVNRVIGYVLLLLTLSLLMYKFVAAQGRT